MGLFDMSKGDGVGFAKIPNKMGFTNEDLLEKLSAVKVTFGTPEMGTVGKYPAVLYKKVGEQFDVFVRIDGKNIIMGKIGTDGVSSLNTAMNAGLDMFLGHKDEGTSEADHAVDELAELIGKMVKGETVTESRASASVKTSSGKALEFFMKQKVLSIKPKFDIFNGDEENEYHVEGDLPRLNFSVQRDGEEVCKLKKKLIAVMPEYSIHVNGKEVGKLKKKLKLLKPELVGKINGQDLKIGGDLLGCDFDIRVGDLTIGHIDTAQTVWQDCYRIRVWDEAYQDIMIALAIVCDSVVDSETD